MYLFNPACQFNGPGTAITAIHATHNNSDIADGNLSQNQSRIRTRIYHMHLHTIYLSTFIEQYGLTQF